MATAQLGPAGGSRKMTHCDQAAIKEVIMERFDLFNARQNGDSTPVASVEPQDPSRSVNGYHEVKRPAPPSPPKSSTPPKNEADDSDISELVDQGPVKKKRKTNVEDDAALAARLQAEEERLARPTRGGATRKSGPVKRRSPKKKKPSARVTASDDSDIEESESGKPQRNTGFHVRQTVLPQKSS